MSFRPVVEVTSWYSVIVAHRHTATQLGVQVVIGLHVALWLFDSFSILPILVGIATHVAYYNLLHGFPFIELTSPMFLLSCGR